MNNLIVWLNEINNQDKTSKNKWLIKITKKYKILKLIWIKKWII